MSYGSRDDLRLALSQDDGVLNPNDLDSVVADIREHLDRLTDDYEDVTTRQRLFSVAETIALASARLRRTQDDVRQTLEAAQHMLDRTSL